MNRDCRRTRNQISDWISGTLSETDKQAFRGHLDDCPDCRRYAHSLEQEDALLADHFARIDANAASRRDRVLQALEDHPANRDTPMILPLRILPRSRYGRPTAVAAVLALVVLTGVLLDRSTAPAYAIADLPARIANARTMHMRGWFYLPQKAQDGTGQAKQELEYWFDCENGRYRLRKPGGIDSQTGEPRYFTTVSDGQYVRSEAYYTRAGKSRKAASYVRVSPFKARLEARKNSLQMLLQMFGNIDQVGSSLKVGREQIDGAPFDIWQCEFESGMGTVSRIRTWLAPDTGEIGRVLFWQKFDRSAPNWPLIFELHTIELGVEPPAGVFNTDPPEGLILNNTKETAPLDPLGVNRQKPCGTYELHLHIGFTLGDGSVILGWSCQDKTRDSQADLFENLVPGGPLPKLAGTIDSLTAMPAQEGITYKGHHLTCTQKDGQFYEWGLYVPDGPAPGRQALLGYSLSVRYQVDENQFTNRPANLTEDLPIADESGFKTWVVGAMAELSDDGAAPASATYERVMTLSRRVRAPSAP